MELSREAEGVLPSSPGLRSQAREAPLSHKTRLATLRHWNAFPMPSGKQGVSHLN